MSSGARGGRKETGDDTARPVLITEARQSHDEELAYRKRRYLLLMSVRIPALLVAMVAFLIWHNGWVALAIIAGSIPIPWIAVLGANDRLPREKGEVRGYAGTASTGSGHAFAAALGASGRRALPVSTAGSPPSGGSTPSGSGSHVIDGEIV